MPEEKKKPSRHKSSSSHSSKRDKEKLHKPKKNKQKKTADLSLTPGRDVDKRIKHREEKKVEHQAKKKKYRNESKGYQEFSNKLIKMGLKPPSIREYTKYKKYADDYVKWASDHLDKGNKPGSLKEYRLYRKGSKQSNIHGAGPLSHEDQYYKDIVLHGMYDPRRELPKHVHRQNAMTSVQRKLFNEFENAALGRGKEKGKSPIIQQYYRPYKPRTVRDETRPAREASQEFRQDLLKEILGANYENPAIRAHVSDRDFNKQLWHRAKVSAEEEARTRNLNLVQNVLGTQKYTPLVNKKKDKYGYAEVAGQTAMTAIPYIL